MIPPNQGSILSQDSYLNRTPCENCYISCYKGLNEISQDVTHRSCNLIYVVKVSNADGEKVTRGILYKFIMLNIPEISHLGKTLISPNW